MAVGIYFATTTGKTEDIADRLHPLLNGTNTPQDLADLQDLSPLNDLDAIICGIPTWNTGADSERSGTAWDSMLEGISKLSLSGKQVAIYGLGDSSTYTENFCDAIEELHAAFEPSGAELIGKTDPAGYDFSDSKSLVDGKFLGLPLDDDNEEDKTETRVENWCVQLVSEGMK